jgi:hypothetical protein
MLVVADKRRSEALKREIREMVRRTRRAVARVELSTVRLDVVIPKEVGIQGRCGCPAVTA